MHMSFVEEEIKPTGESAESERQEQSEWRYVETAYGAHVEAGAFEIRLHWKGPADPNDIRAIARLVAAAPALRDAVKPIRSALGFAEWSSPVHAEEILSHIIEKYYPALHDLIAEGRV